MPRKKNSISLVSRYCDALSEFAAARSAVATAIKDGNLSEEEQIAFELLRSPIPLAHNEKQSRSAKNSDRQNAPIPDSIES
mgnify:CR=1 FL=1